MLNATQTILAFVIIVMFTLGCSGTGINPLTPAGNPGDEISGITTDNPDPIREPVSERVLWGLWNLTFELGEMKIDIEPVRNLQAHFNITNMIIPPACDDCFSIAVKGFDPVTRILDADVTLRNPTSIGGKDVRGILHTNDYGHLITNADDWTAYWDMPGGDTINPFIAYSKDDPNRVFPGNTELTENYLVYIPKPPAYFAITFAVDASWPGNCKEPYSIENFIQDGPLYPLDGASCNIYIDVIDWQDDVDAVQISVPEITGTDFVDMSLDSGNTWTLQLTNNEVAQVGEYDAMITATSANSDDTKLYDFVTVSITDTDSPFVTGVEPNSGKLGESFVDVSVSGSDFMGPCEVELRLDAYTITTTNVEVIDANHVECDFTIPFDADLGVYDIAVENFDTKSGIGEDLFAVKAPKPVATSIDPASGFVNNTIEDAEISGSNFIGSCEVYILQHFYPMTAYDIEVINPNTIICDFDIPMDADLGSCHIFIINSLEQSGGGLNLFTVECPVPFIDHTVPQNGVVGETLIDVEVHGDFFIHPLMELRLKMDGEPDIIAGNVSSVDHALFYCDINIPEGTTPGMWDMNIINGCGESNTWTESFEIVSPIGWAQTFGGLDEDEGIDVAIDDEGNSYVTGFFRNTVDFDPGPGVVERTSVGSEDAFLCKYKPQGTLEWALTWGSSSGDRGNGVAVDDYGVVLVTGWFQGITDFDPGDGTENRTPIGSTDAYLSAFSLDGEFYGVSTWGGTASDGGLAVVADGPDVYVTGVFSGTVDFDWDPVDEAVRNSNGSNDIFILKVVGEGDFGWVQTWGGAGNDEGECVAVDSSGYVYISGNAKGYSVDFDPDPVDTDYKDGGANSWAFLSKFDSTGDYLWSGRWGNSSDTNAAGVAVDSSDNVYVVGHFLWYDTDLDPDPVGEDIKVNIGDADAYMSKFDPSGDYIWGMHWGGAEEDIAIGVASNSAGDIFVSGHFETSADLDPDPVDVDTHTGFGFNVFLSKFDTSGDYVWGKSWGVMGEARGRGVTTDADGNSWITGWFSGSSIDFDPDPVGEDVHPSNGDQDVFLSKFLPDGTW